MNESAYLADVIREFRKLRRSADEAIGQLSAEELFRAPSPESNSAAVLMKHIAGNLRSRWTDFLTSDGEKPFRDRDEEFEIRDADSLEALMAAWSEGWAAMFGALEALTPRDLDRRVTIRGESFSVVQAIQRQMTHYAAHVGQIVYVAKLLAGPRWKTLSIPRGQSKTFNQNPQPYLKT
jgi:hypothetical protein